MRKWHSVCVCVCMCVYVCACVCVYVCYNQISIYELIHELIELVAQDLIGLSD
jgi:hypothetical protein